MEFKSEYYTPWPQYMEENNIKPEDTKFIAPIIQSAEEMVFGFILFLLI